MSRNLTIKQIAEMTGTSTTAVSFVLNGKKGVSEATRKRILDVIDQNHYIPNVNSRRLILQRSFNIILAMDPNHTPFSDFFYLAVMEHIVETSSPLGYNVVLTMLSDSFKDSGLKTMLMQHNADGIIFLHDISSELQMEINKTGIPFVVIDSQKRTPPYPCVQGDYVRAAYCATHHLIENGHKKIAFIGSNRIPDFYMTTFEGYKKALMEYDLSMNPNWIQTDAHDEFSTKKCIQTIIESAPLPTAIFCAGDLFAIHVMNFLQENGYVLPDDFSISSIDDIALARYHYPTLTTVKIDAHDMGRLAVTMLDDLINKIDTDTHQLLRSDNLIIRNSVKRIAE